MTTSVNTQLVDSLAQVILALSVEEQALLVERVQQLRSIEPDLSQFFEGLGALAPDPDQPTLNEISQEVKAVRRQLWAEP
ncbi:MAG: hypothetical protein AAF959_25510 [Cyanobacteria bacterium P01_D01_bin.56]